MRVGVEREEERLAAPSPPYPASWPTVESGGPGKEKRPTDEKSPQTGYELPHCNVQAEAGPNVQRTQRSQKNSEVPPSLTLRLTGVTGKNWMLARHAGCTSQENATCQLCDLGQVTHPL